MKAFFVVFAFFVVTNGQLNTSVSGSVDTKLGGIEANATVDAKNDQNAQNATAAPQQGGSGSGGQSSDLGGLLKGISDGIGQFIKGFAQPIKTFGDTLCFAVQQGTDQALRLDDYIGQSFSVSINGKQVYNGTITGGNSKRAYHGNKRVSKEARDQKREKGETHYKRHEAKHAD